MQLENIDFEIDIPFKVIGAYKERKIYFHLNENIDLEKSALSFKIKYEDIDGKLHIKSFNIVNPYDIFKEKNKRRIPYRYIL